MSERCRAESGALHDERVFTAGRSGERKTPVRSSAGFYAELGDADSCARDRLRLRIENLSRDSGGAAGLRGCVVRIAHRDGEAENEREQLV